MRGSYDIRVSRKRSITYDFKVTRNITVVRGDSGTGKTTLYDMVADHMRLGDASGVTVRCDRPCVALTDADWRGQLSGFQESVVFVDEGFREVASRDFAEALRESGNYCVIFSREELRNLPYSVDEVYRIATSGKRYHRFERLYEKSEEGFRYGVDRAEASGDFSVLLTEDARSGHQFFESCLRQSGVACETSGGNAGVADWLLAHEGENVFVFADGAAFGPYVDRVLKIQRERGGSVTVCLPESFEWLLLKSGIVKSDGLGKVLENPSDFIDGRDFLSWEQFFFEYLRKATAGTPFAYQKGRLRKAYKEQVNASKVLALVACKNIR